MPMNPDDAIRLIAQGARDFAERLDPTAVDPDPAPPVEPGPVPDPVPVPAEPAPEPEPEPEPPVPGPDPTPPTAGAFYVDGGTAAAVVATERLNKYADISKEDVDAVEAVLAKDAQAIWVNSATDAANVFPKMQDAAAKNQILQLVAYFIPNRDGNTPESWSKGGASGVSEYKLGIDILANNLIRSKVQAEIVIEPDALVQPDQLEPERIECLNYALEKLSAIPGCRAWLDAGGPNWRDANFMSSRMKQITWPKNDVGLSTNVSGYHGIDAVLTYIRPIAGSVGKQFVIDTSRNGVNRQASGWCNLWEIEGQKVRQGPKAQQNPRPDIPELAAFLHVKRAGESDGYCSDGPAAGAWFRWWAVSMAKATLAAQS